MNRQALQKKADQYRHDWHLIGGVVIFFNGQPTGWLNVLRSPDHWQPGSIAVDDQGQLHEAVGRTADDGSAHWQAIEEVA